MSTPARARPRRRPPHRGPAASLVLAASAALLAAALAGCGGPAPTPLGEGLDCDGDPGGPAGHPVTASAGVQVAQGAAPRVFAGFQERDGTVATALPECFDGVLYLALADPGSGVELVAAVPSGPATAVRAAEGDGVLHLRDATSFHAELLAASGSTGDVGSFAGWYVHLEDPVAGTYAWEAPLTWQGPGGGQQRGTLRARVEVG